MPSVPEEFAEEYRRYMALVYSYNGYKKFPGNSAMELFNHFHAQFHEGRPPESLPESMDLLRMLLFVAERAARHQGWYDHDHKRFAEAILGKMKEKVERKDFS